MLLLAFATLVAGGTWFAWPRIFGGNGEQAKYQYSTVQRGDIEDVVTATGTLQPRDYVDVGAQVSGQLKKIHVMVGSEVKEGQLLAEIDPTVYRARVDASRAQLRNLRAQLKEKEAQVALAAIQFRRQTALLAEDATTKETLQTAEAALKSAQAQLEALGAQIEQVESSLRADEANLHYARILAPMTGTVVSITARQGQTLNTNQQAPVILRVADLNTMTVQTQVSEADVSRLKLGMDAYFTTLGGQGKRWYGTLAQVEPTPTVTNNVVLYNALFDVPNPDGLLMTQMTAQVFFVVAQAKDALLLPMAALNQGTRGQRGQGGGDGGRKTPTGGNNTPSPTSSESGARGAIPAAQAGSGQRPRQGVVKVASDNGLLEDRTVELGVSNRIQTQVLSGLTEGERVVSGLATPNGGGNAPRMPPRL